MYVVTTGVRGVLVPICASHRRDSDTDDGKRVSVDKVPSLELII